MSDNLDFEAWRCCHDDKKFCPDEGCPKSYGCAREKGWNQGMPTPEGCVSTARNLAPTPGSSS